MTQRKKQVIAIIFACIAIVGSFGLWTRIVPERVSGSVNTALVESEPGAREEKEEESQGAAFKVDLAKHMKKDIVPIIKKVEKKPDQKETLDLVDVIMQNQAKKELKQWEVSEWLSISLPSISVRAPVMLPSRKYWNVREWDLLEKQMQVGLLHGATAYPHSVKPGFKGTVFIAGHSSPPHERAKESAYGHLFAKLPALNRGDKITIAGNGNIVTYQVLRLTVVGANDTSILSQQSDKSILKLITCYPIGSTNKRLVVTAVKIG